MALGNHDRSRLATRLGPAQARVAAVLLLTLAATPCLLYGDELGLADQPVPVERQRDYFARTSGGVSRDPTRTPMPWNDSRNAGFSTAEEARLWLPTAANASEINVEAQLADPTSFLSLYRELLRLRSSSRALRLGELVFVPVGPSRSVLAYSRRQAAEHQIIALNLTSVARTLDLPAAGRVLLSTRERAVGTAVSPSLRIGADEALVIEVEGGRSR